VKILTVVGNRPQFIKAAAVSTLLRERHEEVLVHTGQHYDDSLSEVFFSELGLARADRELGIGGGSNTSQTSRMLAALEPLLAVERPDAALVYGDTNSTLAGALAAAQAQVPVVHVEAGMRSFERTMPEEVNRVLSDHLSTLLLCSSDLAAKNLNAESVTGRVEVVGDVMVDVARRWAQAARANLGALESFDVETGAYLLLTAHRAANVDNPARLDMLVKLVRALPVPIVFPLHPRTRARLQEADLLGELEAIDGVQLSEPLGYAEFGALLHHARAVVTDSGGVQKEAYLASVPCVTLRVSSEWVETIETGWNTLVDLDPPMALAALDRPRPAEHPQLYGDGHAAERCVEAIDSLSAGVGR
jgi:UDP-N-acetylglucosamine 2-epimerase (non-hydrolysing)/UDP-GlcNAc3NAcA epimerase